MSGPAVKRAWPVVLRAQILLTSATLSLAAAWRLTSRAARADRPRRRALAAPGRGRCHAPHASGVGKGLGRAGAGWRRGLHAADPARPGRQGGGFPFRLGPSAAGRRPARSQVPILDPVAAHGHVAPGSASGVRSVEEGPPTLVVAAGLEPGPASVALRVADDEEQRRHRTQSGSGSSLEVHPSAFSPLVERTSRRGRGLRAVAGRPRWALRRPRCGRAGSGCSPDVANERQPGLVERQVGEDPGLAQPVVRRRGVCQQVRSRVFFARVDEGLHEQEWHRRRLRLDVGYPGGHGDIVWRRQGERRGHAWILTESDLRKDLTGHPLTVILDLMVMIHSSRPQGGRAETMVLVERDDDLELRPVRLRHRVAARLHARDLDRALAAGASPDSSVSLSLHAARLYRPGHRSGLAHAVRRLAHSPHDPRASRSPCPSERSVRWPTSSRPSRHAWSAPGPVDVRGVAKIQEPALRRHRTALPPIRIACPTRRAPAQS